MNSFSFRININKLLVNHCVDELEQTKIVWRHCNALVPNRNWTFNKYYQCKRLSLIKYSFYTRIFIVSCYEITKNGTFSFNIVRNWQVSKHEVIDHPWMTVFGFISINYLLIIVSTNWNRPKHCVTSLQCSGTFQIVTAINIQQVLWQCKRLSLINIRFILVFL